MRCPKCGNELSREEAFCGQCGAPTILPANPPQMTNAPAPRNGGLLRAYNAQSSPQSGALNTNASPQAGSFNTQAVPPSSPYPQGTMPPNNSYPMSPPPPSQPARPQFPGPSSGQLPSPPRRTGPQQPKNFYQDATEAMIVSPANGNPNYPPYGSPAAPPQNPGPSRYNLPAQPFQTGNFANPGYPPMQPFPSGQGYGYGMQPNVAPSPKQHGRTFLIVVCIMFVIAFLVATGVGALYLLRNQSPQATTPSSTFAPQATTIPTPSPTSIPSPTPIPSPSPTLTPTSAAVPGFTFCDASCTTNGYSVEYPSGWVQGTTSDSTGVEFKNPQSHDIFAAFKATGSTGSEQASDLVNTDLQNNFASLQNYAAPTSLQSTTIGGVTWVFSAATFTLNNQTERIEVYATVRQGKDYIIELEAPDAQFDLVNSRYFVTMLANFQFQSGT